MTKVNVYVDGFNLYHALKNLRIKRYRWLNLKKLAQKFIDSDVDVIENIYYFSALATHIDSDTVSKHKAYIEALKTEGITFVAGNFKAKIAHISKEIREKYNIPNSEKSLTHEEKESDVNLALYILRDAMMKICDKMLIITNDTDISPAIKMAKEQNDKLDIKVLTPPTFKKCHQALLRAAHQPYTISITQKKIEESLFPYEITKPNGKKIFIPKKWI